MSPETRDLTIETALADPMIRAAMKADRVSPRDFEALLRSAARDLNATPSRLPLAQAATVAHCTRATLRSFCFA